MLITELMSLLPIILRATTTGWILEILVGNIFGFMHDVMKQKLVTSTTLSWSLTHFLTSTTTLKENARIFVLSVLQVFKTNIR